MRRAAYARIGFFAAGVGAIGAGACDAVLGIQEYPAADGGIARDAGTEGGAATEGDAGSLTACGVTAGSASCASCIEGACCAEATACNANPECAAYEDCLVPCGPDYVCRAQCAASHRAGALAIPALDQCIAARCASNCDLQCGTTESFSTPSAAEACQTCLAASCATVAACMTDLGCMQLAQCGAQCSSEDCLWTCVADSDAAAPFVGYSEALEGCRTECALGAYWTCENGPPPVLSQTGTTKLTLNLVEYPSGSPLVGATVKACAPSDRGCSAPVVAPGTTDQQGNVTFDLAAAGLFPFGGYFDIASDAYPTLLFLQTPLSVPEVTFPKQIVPTVSAIESEYAAGGVAPEAADGTILIQTTDCHWIPAGNVFAALDLDGGPAGAFTYLDMNGGSSTTSGTTGSGYAVALNVAVDTLFTIVTTPAAVGKATASVQMFARPGTVSMMTVYPVDVQTTGQ